MNNNEDGFYEDYHKRKQRISGGNYKSVDSKLEETELYKINDRDMRLRFKVLTPDQPESKLSTPERLKIRYDRIQANHSLNDIVDFLAFISEKMTDKNGKASKLYTNIKYTEKYNECNKKFKELNSSVKCPCSSLVKFCKSFKDRYKNDATYIEFVNVLAKDQDTFIYNLFEILLSASIFTRIEDTHYNIKRDLSSGMFIKTQLAAYNTSDSTNGNLPKLRFNLSEKSDSPNNHNYINQCAELFLSLMQDKENYSHLLLPLSVDEVSGTALVLVGHSSLPKIEGIDYCDIYSGYFYLLMISYYKAPVNLKKGVNNPNPAPCRISSYSCIRYSGKDPRRKNKYNNINLFEIDTDEDLEQDPSIKRTGNWDADGRNIDTEDFDPVFLSFEDSFSEFIECVDYDRTQLNNQNGSLPKNCPQIFSDYFTQKQPKQYKEEDMRAEMARLEREREL